MLNKKEMLSLKLVALVILIVLIIVGFIIFFGLKPAEESRGVNPDTTIIRI